MIEQPDEKVSSCRVGPKLEQASQQEIALLPAHEVLIALDLVWSRKEATALHLQENGGHQQEVAELFEREFAGGVQDLFDEGIDDWRQLDVEDVDLMG